jgi:DNA polymerase-4
VIAASSGSSRSGPPIRRYCARRSAVWLRRLADGHDDRPVVPNRAAKSSGTENTFSQDLVDAQEIRAAVDEMAREGAAWLERKTLLCRTVTIKVRYSDFTTITRSHTQLPPTRNSDNIAMRAVALLDRTDAGRRPVRLLGVSVHNLSDTVDTSGDLSLPFDSGESRRELSRSGENS